ncbi:Flp family type IVb pilin [Bradyrhizobium sp. CB1650]|nr:Flp family type IVb pilin [Bradyrhizobium sp. CB1650]WGD56800.1 Flp family type IVb pilin [Bradyrhizobium sp. CB1650]
MRFWRDQAGANSIEYGLIAAGISVALGLALTVLGPNRNVACSSLPSPNVSTRQLDKLDFLRDPRNDRQGE